MSLSFLQKKSWHTAKTSNQEKVWIEEEKKKKELAITAEKMKEIAQEREHEEMLRITGRGDEADAAALNWMYQGGKKTEKEEEKTAEDYLLGKKFEGTAAADKSDVQAASSSDFVGGLVSEQKTVNERNEEFAHSIHDPLYAMKKRQMEVTVESRKRQRDMDILKGGTGEFGKAKKAKKEKKEKKEKKKKRKKSKKEKKEKKRRRRSESESSDSSSSAGAASHSVGEAMPPPPSIAPPAKKQGYGLQMSGAARAAAEERKKFDKDKVDYSSVMKEAGEEWGEAEEKLGGGAQGGRMSKEDKARALQEMQRDAASLATSRVESSKSNIDDDCGEDEGGNKASFLSEMAGKAHGVDGRQERDLGERLRANRTNNQRGGDRFL